MTNAYSDKKIIRKWSSKYCNFCENVLLELIKIILLESYIRISILI